MAASSCFRANSIVVNHHSDSDEEEVAQAGPKVPKANIITRLMGMDCIVIKNKTGQPIKVYLRAPPKASPEPGNGQNELGFAGGYEAAIKFVTTVLGNDTATFNQVVAPPDPHAGHKSERIRVSGETLLSIRRCNGDDQAEPRDWEWDCLDMLVHPGQKVRVKGTAVPLQSFFPPA